MIEETTNNTIDNVLSGKRPAWSWKDLLFIILGIALIFILVLYVTNAVVSRQGGNLPNELSKPNIWQSLGLAGLEVVALVLGVYFLGMRRRSIRWSDLGFIPFSSKWLLVVIGLSIVVIPLSGLITTLLLTLLHLPLENPQLPALVPEGLDLGGALAMFLLVGLVVPVAEEIFFRGVIYNFLRARIGIWFAILFSALIFAIAHGDLAVGTSAFVIGIAIAWAYEKSGSLWTAILIHAANNSVKIVLLYIFVLLKLIPT